MIDGLPLLDALAYLDWHGESYLCNFGIYSHVSAENKLSKTVRCGRVRGSEEDEKHVASGSVRLKGDDKWVVTVRATQIIADLAPARLKIRRALYTQAMSRSPEHQVLLTSRCLLELNIKSQLCSSL